MSQITLNEEEYAFLKRQMAEERWKEEERKEKERISMLISLGYPSYLSMPYDEVKEHYNHRMEQISLQSEKEMEEWERYYGEDSDDF